MQGRLDLVARCITSSMFISFGKNQEDARRNAFSQGHCWIDSDSMQELRRRLHYIILTCPPCCDDGVDCRYQKECGLSCVVVR